MTLPHPYVIPGLILVIPDNNVRVIRLMSPDEILDVAEDFMLVPRGFSRKVGRGADVVECRHLAAFAMKQFKKMTCTAIGEVMNKDHTTIIYGWQRIENLMTTDPNYATKIKYFTEALYTSKLKQNDNKNQAFEAAESD